MGDGLPPHTYAEQFPAQAVQAVQDALAKIVADLKMPPEYTTGAAGTSREQVKAFMARHKLL